jgi:hypothetical protein
MNNFMERNAHTHTQQFDFLLKVRGGGIYIFGGVLLVFPGALVFAQRTILDFWIHRDYLSCMNLYRRRVWTCKVSGKSNLTYEEAVVSERKATEKVQQFPKEFMGPVLHLVQFSCVIFLSSPCLWNIEI